ncbi:MAG: AAA family ATPase [Candidatus Omnitrophica bacterium]|nr:AAA family ATPase [Candidatus Omnitrophota bacterium]
MYKDFFKLQNYPFGVTANPKYLYWSRGHEEALSFLIFGIEMRKGFILLTGEIGAGKTTVCRALAETLSDAYRTAFVFNPNLSELELLETIVEDFGIKPERKSRKGYFDALNRFLIGRNQEGQTAMLIIDEAQNLSRRALEQVRLLSNLESAESKLLQIILVGQPELRDTLGDPRLTQLKQRITVSYHLKPLERDEVGRYIDHRLTVARSGEEEKGKFTIYKGNELRFEPTTYDLIYDFSNGIPRLINSICDKALLAAFVKETWIITDELITEAQNEAQGIKVEGVFQ